MNALVKTEIPALLMAEDELVKVMQNSVYPGAQIESIKLALGYCRSMQLDPMTKPVHIVPMDVKVKGQNGAKDEYVKRDVIMPGIELYRTKAARSGEYAGCSEPLFGPTLKIAFKAKQWVSVDGGGRAERMVEDEIDYPEWCKVTVRRIVDGREVEFTAVEYWTENYATAGRDTIAPNAMWKKRPRGQLAKCTEAQALRKAFPEVGALPTMEEMEGKTIGEDAVVIDVPRVAMPKERATEPTASPSPPAAESTAKSGEVLPPETTKGDAPKASGKPASASQLTMIRKKAELGEITMAEISKRFKLPSPSDEKPDLDPLAGISTETGNAILDWLRDPAS